jgi:HemY protein
MRSTRSPGRPSETSRAMIRVVVFLGLVCLVALGIVWLADRPGEVAITWLGWRIESSVLVLLAAVALLAALLLLLFTLARGLWRSPRRIARAMHEQRERKGRLAVTRGLVAVGVGDQASARRFAQQARRLRPDEPLALLLEAQAAQLAGDRGGAETAFREMARHADTRLLGLRGLYVEAQRRDDFGAARHFAEAAAHAAPGLPWAGQAVLEFRCRAADWEGALEILDAHLRNGLIDKATHRRHTAVLTTARALTAEATDPGVAKTLAVEAARLAPDLVPAAALAGRLLADAGETRRARKILEAAWRVNPHPDLAETYAHLRIGDSARDRLARVKALARQAEGHVESALAVARAALDAREFTVARQALAPLVAEPTQRVAMLMAELEEIEQGDVGRARQWMARALRAARDPAWTADGVVSEQWLPVSPVTGRIDAFEWKVPLAELPGPGPAAESAREPTIEAAPMAPGGGSVPAPARADASAAAGAIPDGDRNAGATDVRTPSPPMRNAAPAPPAAKPPAAQPIIPLVHAPDDPGPEGEALVEAETEPEPEKNESWHPFGSLFR